jgi:hypothetical protein
MISITSRSASGSTSRHLGFSASLMVSSVIVLLGCRHSVGAVSIRRDHSATFQSLRNSRISKNLIDIEKPYRNFQDWISVHRQDINNLLKRFKRDGKRIHVWGLSGLAGI